MSVLKVFCLFDRKSGLYMPPFTFPAVGQAIRAVTDLASDTEHVVGRYPADFALFQIGQFDEDIGLLDAWSKPDHVVDVINCLPAKASE